MRADARKARRAAILDAAEAVLAEKGWSGASMAAIARRAGASKETLYAWFGDREGLFAALIRRNAAGIETALDAVAEANPAEALTEAGAALLGVLLGPSALALNRAAIADETGALGRLLLAQGRDATLPRIAALAPTGASAEFGAVWLALLKGDWQLAQLMSAAAPPAPAALRARAAWAAAQAIRLAGPCTPVR